MNRPKADDELQLQGVIESREYYGLYIKYYIRVDGPDPQGHREERRHQHLRAGRDRSPWASIPSDVMSYDVPAEA